MGRTRFTVDDYQRQNVRESATRTPFTVEDYRTSRNIPRQVPSSQDLFALGDWTNAAAALREETGQPWTSFANQAEQSQAILDVARDNNMKPEVLGALLQTESNTTHLGVESEAGAVGIGQISSAVARDMEINRYSAQENLAASGGWFASLLNRYKEFGRAAMPMALAAYHAGFPTVDRYGDVPPQAQYPKTYEYVKKIMDIIGPERAIDWQARFQEAEPVDEEGRVDYAANLPEFDAYRTSYSFLGFESKGYQPAPEERNDIVQSIDEISTTVGDVAQLGFNASQNFATGLSDVVTTAIKGGNASVGMLVRSIRVLAGAQHRIFGTDDDVYNQMDKDLREWADWFDTNGVASSRYSDLARSGLYSEELLQMMESTYTSLAAGAIGTAAGSPVLGFAISGATTFALSEYDRTKDTLMDEGYSEEVAMDVALVNAAAEWGTEFISDIIGAGLLKGVVSLPLREVAKKGGLRALLTILAHTAKIAPRNGLAEGVSEALNAAIQKWNMERIGRDTGQTYREAVSEAFVGGFGGGVMFPFLGMTGAGLGLTNAQQRRTNRTPARSANISRTAPVVRRREDDELAAIPPAPTAGVTPQAPVTQEQPTSLNYLGVEWEFVDGQWQREDTGLLAPASRTELFNALGRGEIVEGANGQYIVQETGKEYETPDEALHDINVERERQEKLAKATAEAQAVEARRKADEEAKKATPVATVTQAERAEGTQTEGKKGPSQTLLDQTNAQVAKIENGETKQQLTTELNELKAERDKWTEEVNNEKIPFDSNVDSKFFAKLNKLAKAIAKQDKTDREFINKHGTAEQKARLANTKPLSARDIQTEFDNTKKRLNAEFTATDLDFDIVAETYDIAQGLGTEGRKPSAKLLERAYHIAKKRARSQFAKDGMSQQEIDKRIAAMDKRHAEGFRVKVKPAKAKPVKPKTIISTKGMKTFKEVKKQTKQIGKMLSEALGKKVTVKIKKVKGKQIIVTTENGKVVGQDSLRDFKRKLNHLAWSQAGVTDSVSQAILTKMGHRPKEVSEMTAAERAKLMKDTGLTKLHSGIGLTSEHMDVVMDIARDVYNTMVKPGLNMFLQDLRKAAGKFWKAIQPVAVDLYNFYKHIVNNQDGFIYVWKAGTVAFNNMLESSRNDFNGLARGYGIYVTSLRKYARMFIKSASNNYISYKGRWSINIMDNNVELLAEMMSLEVDEAAVLNQLLRDIYTTVDRDISRRDVVNQIISDINDNLADQREVSEMIKEAQAHAFALIDHYKAKVSGPRENILSPQEVMMHRAAIADEIIDTTASNYLQQLQEAAATLRTKHDRLMMIGRDNERLYRVIEDRLFEDFMPAVGTVFNLKLDMTEADAVWLNWAENISDKAKNLLLGLPKHILLAETTIGHTTDTIGNFIQSGKITGQMLYNRLVELEYDRQIKAHLRAVGGEKQIITYDADSLAGRLAQGRASARLAKLGIAGMEYKGKFDEDSYVIYDKDLVSIVETHVKGAGETLTPKQKEAMKALITKRSRDEDEWLKLGGAWSEMIRLVRDQVKAIKGKSKSIHNLTKKQWDTIRAFTIDKLMDIYSKKTYNMSAGNLLQTDIDLFHQMVDEFRPIKDAALDHIYRYFTALKAGTAVTVQAVIKNITSTTRISNRLKQEFESKGVGHLVFSGRIENLVTSGAISGQVADMIRAVFMDTGDELFQKFSLKGQDLYDGMWDRHEFILGMRRDGMLTTIEALEQSINNGSLSDMDRKQLQDYANLVVADTFFHEFGHMGLDLILSQQERDAYMKWFDGLSKEQREDIIKDTLTFKMSVDAMHSLDSRQHLDYLVNSKHEFFAAMFAEYLMTSRVSNERNRTIFQKMKVFLTERIEKLLAELGIAEKTDITKVAPNLVPLFERVLSGKPANPLVFLEARKKEGLRGILGVGTGGKPTMEYALRNKIPSKNIDRADFIRFGLNPKLSTEEMMKQWDYLLANESIAMSNHMETAQDKLDIVYATTVKNLVAQAKTEQAKNPKLTVTEIMNHFKELGVVVPEEFKTILKTVLKQANIKKSVADVFKGNALSESAALERRTITEKLVKLQKRIHKAMTSGKRSKYDLADLRRASDMITDFMAHNLDAKKGVLPQSIEQAKGLRVELDAILAEAVKKEKTARRRFEARAAFERDKLLASPRPDDWIRNYRKHQTRNGWFNLMKLPIIKLAEFVRERDMSIQPMAIFFDLLSGGERTFENALQNMKTVMDYHHGKYLEMKHAMTFEAIQLAKDGLLTKKERRHVGRYMVASTQEGKARLLTVKGESQELIDEAIAFVEGNKHAKMLVKELNSKYVEMRGLLNQVLEEVYNVPAEQAVKAYFPLLRDWESLETGDVLYMLAEMRDEFKNNLDPDGKKPKERKDFKLDLDAISVFTRYSDSISYIYNMADTVEVYKKAILHEDYEAHIGYWAQQSLRGWLQLMSTNRYAVSPDSTFLARMVQRVGYAVLSLSLKVGAKQFISSIHAMTHLGVKAVVVGAKLWFNKDYRELVRQFPEVRFRTGFDSDIQRNTEQLMLQETRLTKKGVMFPNKSKLIAAAKAMKTWRGQKYFIEGFFKTKWGYVPIAALDRMVAEQIAISAYVKWHADNGIPVDFQNINKEAMLYAQEMLGRSASRPFKKDEAIGRSTGSLAHGIGGVAVAKMLTMFQGPIIEMMGHTKYRLLRADGVLGVNHKYIREHPEDAIRAFIVFIVGLIAEGTIEYGWYKMMASSDEQQLEANDYVEQLAISSATNVPVWGSPFGADKYGNANLAGGVLAEKGLVQPLAAFQDWRRSVDGTYKKQDTIMRHRYRAYVDVAESAALFFGVTGTRLWSTLAKKLIASQFPYQVGNSSKPDPIAPSGVGTDVGGEGVAP